MEVEEALLGGSGEVERAAGEHVGCFDGEEAEGAQGVDAALDAGCFGGRGRGEDGGFDSDGGGSGFEEVSQLTFTGVSRGSGMAIKRAFSLLLVDGCVPRAMPWAGTMTDLWSCFGCCELLSGILMLSRLDGCLTAGHVYQASPRAMRVAGPVR